VQITKEEYDSAPPQLLYDINAAIDYKLKLEEAAIKKAKETAKTNP
jgi:hypothetical protein